MTTEFQPEITVARTLNSFGNTSETNPRERLLVSSYPAENSKRFITTLLLDAHIRLKGGEAGDLLTPYFLVLPKIHKQKHPKLIVKEEMKSLIANVGS